MTRKRPAAALAALLLALIVAAGLATSAHRASAKAVHHVSARPAADPFKPAAGLGLGLSLGSDGLLTSGGTSRRTWSRRAAAEGASIIRLGVSWTSVAETEPSEQSNPDSPGYYWISLDRQISELSSEGLQVEVDVYDAPAWAEGPHKPSWVVAGTWRPNDSALKAFAEALAARYSGRYVVSSTGKRLPRVRYWEAWNEPNTSAFLTPQWSNDRQSCTSSFKPASSTSPGIYRGLQNAFYAGIKARSASGVVLMAGLAPYSDPECDSSLYRMSPESFMQQVFCLNSANQHRSGCTTVTHLDAINVHPYPPPDAHYPMTLSLPDGETPIADVYKLENVLHAAERQSTVSPRRNVGFWVTETGWDTNPPDNGGTSNATAVQWMNEGFYLLWKEGVRQILWLRLADISHFHGYDWPGGSGLYTSSGSPKPIATSYRFLFMTHRLSRTRVASWGRVPVSGTLKIEQLRGGHWRTVQSGHVSRDEVFTSSLGLVGTAKLRAQVGGQTSEVWVQTSATSQG